MDSALKIALILTAFDRASGVIDSMTNRANANFDRMRRASRQMAEGFTMMATGNAGMNFLKGPIKDFAEVESAAARFQSSMMDGNGLVDPKQWEKVNALARDLGNELPGTTADFYRMFKVMKDLGTNADTILNGTGKAAAYLAIVTGESYDTVAETAGRLQNATGIAARDANAFFDTIARTKNMGVPLYDMEQAFARSSGQLKFLGIQGLESSKQMSAFFATFIRQGLGGQTVGTNFSRILGELLNPTKYAKMQEAARSYGLTLDLLDAKGNFGGMENFITQFDKLSGLSNDKISAILSPLTGAEGLDDQMLKALSKGRGEYDKMVSGMASQADINKKVGVQMDTLTAKGEALEGTWTNIKATFASSLKPSLDVLIDLLNRGAVYLQNFTEQHPQLSQFIGTFIALASAGIMVAGAIRVVTGVMTLLRIATMANPITLWITVIAAGAALIITNWKAISTFFSNMWAGVKASFNSFVDYVFSIPSKLYQAGANIVSSIWAGMKARWGTFIQWWADKIQQVRNYLPFSPAKVGPLKDIHRIKLIETIAGAIRPQPLLNALDSTIGAVASYGGNSYGGSSGGGTIHFAPVINLSGGATARDGDMLAERLKRDVLQVMRQEQQRQQRTSF